MAWRARRRRCGVAAQDRVLAVRGSRQVARGDAGDVAALLSEFEDRAAVDGATGRLTGFAIALALYVVLGLWLKSYVVNWIVGPLFPLIVLGLLPRWWARWRPAWTVVTTR